MAKQELFAIPVLGPAIRAVGAYPVDRKGSAIAAIKRSVEVLRARRRHRHFSRGHAQPRRLGRRARRRGAAGLAQRSAGAAGLRDRYGPREANSRHSTCISGRPSRLPPIAKRRATSWRPSAKTCLADDPLASGRRDENTNAFEGHLEDCDPGVSRIGRKLPRCCAITSATATRPGTARQSGCGRGCCCGRAQPKAGAEDALDAAAAIEILHNYSLVHDDIEDGDELRHGRPTLWAVYGIPQALNAGDAMCALSFLVLERAPARHRGDRVLQMVRALHEAHATMCDGQSLDLALRTREHVRSRRSTTR